MHKAFIQILAGVAMVAAVGCNGKKEEPQAVRWVKGQGAPPAVFSAEQFHEVERSVMVNEEIVEFAPQKWGPARVEGGVLQKVRDSEGEVVFGHAEFMISPETEMDLNKEQVQQLHDQRFVFLQKIAKKLDKKAGVKILGEPEVVIVGNGKLVEAVYQVLVLDISKSQVLKYTMSPRGRVLGKEPVSSSSFDVEATVFSPTAERELQDVLLKKLAQTGRVETASHWVHSQTPQNATPEQAPFKFSVDDPRFDQVQVFYFVQQGLDFFQNKFGFKMPVAVEIETSVSYPDKSNAAFAHGSKIWLGRGDDKEFKLLAQDPSIVLHELGHVIIGQLSRLPSQGEGGSLNEGFADYLAATQIESPKLGTVAYLPAPFMRNLENSKLYSQKNGGLYHDSLIVSGTLWTLRTKLGAKVVDQLAIKTLTRLGPSKQLSDFSYAINLAAQGRLTAEQLVVLKDVLKARQWPE